MRKLLLLPLLTILLITCQKEQFREVNTIDDNLFPKTFKTQDDVLSFLSQEMPEVYTPEEINRLKSMLEEPESEDFKRSGNTVELPAGSVDALQAAVDEAGPGGTVLVKAGEHTENGLVTIGHRVKIQGENGAQLNLGNSIFQDLPTPLTKGIRLLNADHSVIKNIIFQGGSMGAGSALICEDSDNIRIEKNVFENVQFPIMIDFGHHISIKGNTMTFDPAWQSLGAGSGGISSANAEHVSIIDNKMTNPFYGIFVSDKAGINWGNQVTGSFIGQILCKFLGASNPDGKEILAEESCNHWLFALNKSSNTAFAGILVVDGANNNTLIGNSGSGNLTYDMELAGESERFGFTTPTCFNNQVWSLKEQKIKDCGLDNKVLGGTLIDTSIDACF